MIRILNSSSSNPRATRPAKGSSYLLLWLLFFTFSVLAADTYESARPKIEKITAKFHEEKAYDYYDVYQTRLPDDWEKQREGLLNFVAELNAFYPNDHLIFLARDAEYLYDIARLVAADDPEALKRLHLMNVSSNSQESEHLAAYAKANGLTPQKLGKSKAIFVDSGFVGSIPNLIQQELPTKALHDRVYVHLLASSSDFNPQSRAYLSFFDSTLAKQKKVDGVSIVDEMENLPHYTDSSEKLMKTKKGVQAESTKADESERKSSKMMMEDLKAYVSDSNVRRSYDRALKDMKLLTEGARGQRKLTPQQIKAAAKRLEEEGVKGFLYDLWDAQRTGNVAANRLSLDFWKKAPKGSPRLAEHELTPPVQRSYAAASNLRELHGLELEDIGDLTPQDRRTISRLIAEADPEVISRMIRDMLPKKSFDGSEFVGQIAKTGVRPHELLGFLASSPYWTRSRKLPDIKAQIRRHGGIDAKTVREYFADDVEPPSLGEGTVPVRVGQILTTPAGSKMKIVRIDRIEDGVARYWAKGPKSEKYFVEQVVPGASKLEQTEFRRDADLKHLYEDDVVRSHEPLMLKPNEANSHARIYDVTKLKPAEDVFPKNKAVNPNSAPVRSLAAMVNMLGDETQSLGILNHATLLWDGSRWHIRRDRGFDVMNQTPEGNEEKGSHRASLGRIRQALGEKVAAAVAKAQKKDLEKEKEAFNYRRLDKLAGVTLDDSDMIQLPDGQLVTISSLIAESDVSMVYEVEDDQNIPLQLHVAKRGKEKEFNGAIEAQKELKTRLKSAGFGLVDFVGVGNDYLLAQYPEGGEQLDSLEKQLQRWERQQNYQPYQFNYGYQSHDYQHQNSYRDDPAWEKLVDSLKKAAERGIYLEDLPLEHFHWDRERWVINPEVGVKTGLTAKDIVQKYKRALRSNESTRMCDKLIDKLGEE